VRGALLIVFGALIFLPWILWVFFQDPPPPHELQSLRESVHRYGPLLLAAYSLLNLLVASEGALTFSPAEVNLLFPGPLSRRQLLAYKLLSVVGGAALTAVILTMFLRNLWANFLAGLLGLLLTAVFLQLLPMTLAMVASSVGARAYNRQRKILLIVLIVAVVAALLPYLGELASSDREQLLAELERLEGEPVAKALLTPFRWFIEAFTATNLPDLLRNGGLSLLVILVLLGLIFVLDAQYLEASATASERAYARLERMRRGGPAALTLGGPGAARLTVPALPWWGGVGPVAWRQLLTLVRTPMAALTVVVVGLLFALPPVLGARARGDEGQVLALVMLLVVTLFVTPMLPFDFRGDLDRIEVLKTLPLSSWRIAVGQVLVPALFLTVFQLLTLGGLMIYWGRAGPLVLAGAAFVPLMNLLLMGLENLLFLWFPTRQMGRSPGDLQTLGRLMLLWMAKLFMLQVILIVAFLFGWTAYLVGGQSLVAGSVAGWVVLAGCVVGLVPLLGLAFRRFDVSCDIP
jgi:hypothetical protein